VSFLSNDSSKKQKKTNCHDGSPLISIGIR
jgi:hypothetical protein